MACSEAKLAAGFSLYTGITSAVRCIAGTSAAARNRLPPNSTPATAAAAGNAIQPNVIVNSTTMSHWRNDAPVPNDTTAIISRLAYTVSASAPPNVTTRAASVFAAGTPSRRSTRVTPKALLRHVEQSRRRNRGRLACGY